MESTLSAVATTSGIVSHQINWNLVLEYLKVILSWPGVVLIIALMYKVWKLDIIKALFLVSKYIKKIPTPLGDFEMRQQGDVKPDPDEAKKIEDIKREAVNQAEDKFKKYITETVVPLISSLQENIEFERIWGIIFGGQVELLQLLSLHSLSLLAYFEFYNKVKAKYPSLTVDIKSYLIFLINNNLIKQVGEELQITQRGNNFINYTLIERKYSQLFKPF